MLEGVEKANYPSIVDKIKFQARLRLVVVFSRQFHKISAIWRANSVDAPRKFDPSQIRDGEAEQIWTERKKIRFDAHTLHRMGGGGVAFARLMRTPLTLDGCTNWKRATKNC